LILSFLFLLKTTIGFSQDGAVLKDILSGFNLTKSYEGFTSKNIETLVLEEKVAIYFTEIKEVSQEFNFRNQPVINMVFFKEAAEKLRNISLKLEEYPLVIAYRKK